MNLNYCLHCNVTVPPKTAHCDACIRTMREDKLLAILYSLSSNPERTIIEQQIAACLQLIVELMEIQ